MRRDPVQLAHQHADPLRPLRDVLVDAEQLLGGQGEDQLVEERRRVVHAGDVGGALEVGEVLARLLHAGVQVADDRLGAQHRLALELEHEAQHAVGDGCCGPMLMIIVSSSRRALADEVGGLGLGHAQHGAELAQQLGGVGASSRGASSWAPSDGLRCRRSRGRRRSSVTGRPARP